jgi:hypothetical protein
LTRQEGVDWRVELLSALEEIQLKDEDIAKEIAF